MTDLDDQSTASEPVQIPVDYNRLTRSGHVLASLRRVEGSVNVGDIVEIYAHGEPDMRYAATVTRINTDDGRLELEVHWK